MFAREFFLPEDRNNNDPPKAPACEQCNRRKAGFEHYLLSVLPFGARYARARENLLLNATRRLPKNKRLSREIIHAIEPAWVRDGNGLYLPSRTIQFDPAKLEGFLKMVARGLAGPWMLEQEKIPWIEAEMAILSGLGDLQ